MKTFFSEKHKLRDANTELYGGELVKPFERPQRLDFIVDEIKIRGLGEILNPNKVNLNIIGKVHDQDYIKFLDNAWNEWIKEGFKGEAIPTVWPSRSMNSEKIPTFIEGKLGYYSLAGETSISNGSIEAAYEACLLYTSPSPRDP